MAPKSLPVSNITEACETKPNPQHSTVSIQISTVFFFFFFRGKGSATFWAQLPPVELGWGMRRESK